MPKIFVSYRRIDSQERAHRIADWLVLKYGRENVFIDVDTIGGGTDFIGSIEDSLAQSDVILIIIGDKWVDELNKRATQPDVDFVRLEVRTGLDKIPLVIPVLMSQDIDIRANQLVDDIRPMMRRNFRFARGGMEFHRDMEQIQRDIDKEFPVIVPQPAPAEDRKIPFIPIMIVLGLIGAVILFAILSNQPPDTGTSVTQGETATSVEATITETEQPTHTATKEPTATPEPSETPDIEAEALTVVAVQATDEAIVNITATAIEHNNQTATATLWTDTPTPDVTASIDAELTQWAGETATQSAVDSATQDALVIISTATLIPTPSNGQNIIISTLSTEQIAMTPVTSNDDWTPIEREFNGVAMVLVPVGCFMMGSDNDESDERPIHQQCFDEPFWIDQYEVTQGDFDRLGGIKAAPNGFDDDNRPIERITWFEAQDYCMSRGGRLPTEREWEYAARGVDNLIYPWGNEWSPDNVVWRNNSDDQTAEVGSRSGISWVGTNDMSGNVWEWVSSLYQSYEYNSTAENDADTSSRRIGRGGSWAESATDIMNTANRVPKPPMTTARDFGFRCVRDIDS